MDINSAVGRGRGLDEAKIAAIATWKESGEFSDLERDVLALADAMADAPCDVDRTLFDRLLAALGREGLVELSGAIAWENFRARGNRVFDARSEGYYEGAVCMVPVREAGG